MNKAQIFGVSIFWLFATIALLSNLFYAAIIDYGLGLLMYFILKEKRQE